MKITKNYAKTLSSTAQIVKSELRSETFRSHVLKNDFNDVRNYRMSEVPVNTDSSGLAHGLVRSCVLPTLLWRGRALHVRPAPLQNYASRDRYRKPDVFAVLMADDLERAPNGERTGCHGKRWRERGCCGLTGSGKRAQERKTWVLRRTNILACDTA